MKAWFYLTILYFSCGPGFGLEYSKIEYEGCPENAYCKKETGANRKKWIEQLRGFSTGKISEQKLNSFVQSEYGLPVSGWAQEEGSLQPNILLWDSPCKQHSKSTNKYYIAEVFRKNFRSNELKEIPNVIFSRVVMLDESKQPFAITVPRGDAPLFLKDGNLYYLREEEGMFYGLLIDKNGKFAITKNETSTEPAKEATCSKDLIALFNREAPSPNFYQGTFCKEIWDKTSKSYKTVLLGWSCN
ncbi:MAG: hypothetical protein WC635_00400 [Bacteriovorax sp.]|jgi:hypothetical protein